MSVFARRLQRVSSGNGFQVVRLSSPARSEVRDRSGNWLATFTDGCYTALIKGTQRTFTEASRPVSDTFSRSRAAGSGWGMMVSASWSDSGLATLDNCYVNGGAGKIDVTTAGSAYRMTSNTHWMQDVNVTATFGVDKNPIGASTTGALLLGYQDANNHYIARVSLGVPTATVSDTFARTTSGGWGGTPSGVAWDYDGAALADYSVNGSAAIQSHNTINASRRSVIGMGMDFDATVRTGVDQLAVGNSLSTGILGRYQDRDNHYIFRIRISTTQRVYASIQTQVTGINTTLGSEVQIAGLTHTAGAYYQMRARAVGSTLELKVWADGASEPGAWSVSLTDDTFTDSGPIALRSVVSTGFTGTLPVAFMFDDFNCVFDGGASNSAVYLRLYKQVAGATTSIGSAYNLGVTYDALEGDTISIRATMSGGVLQARAWHSGTAEPSTWQITGNDSTFTSGRVGIRCLLFKGSTTAPVTYSWSNFSATGTWSEPPTVTHDKWLYMLPAPFGGVDDTMWLQDKLATLPDDVLAFAMEYVYGAPSATDGGGIRYKGDASYGPLLADGSRQEGSDFYDYLGVPWKTYSPDPNQYGCVDCSGAIALSYGYRGGLDNNLIAANTRGIAANGPGILIISDAGTQPTPAQLTGLQVGDLVCFDNDTAPPEPAGQLDHIGFFLGVDSLGKMRVYSSRKPADGPTLADIGGLSIIDGTTNDYTTGLRVVRRF